MSKRQLTAAISWKAIRAERYLWEPYEIIQKGAFWRVYYFDQLIGARIRELADAQEIARAHYERIINGGSI